MCGAAAVSHLNCFPVNVRAAHAFAAVRFDVALKRRAKCSISIGEKIKAEILGEAPLKERPAPETNA
jgi:hypothetical protein